MPKHASSFDPMPFYKKRPFIAVVLLFLFIMSSFLLGLVDMQTITTTLYKHKPASRPLIQKMKAKGCVFDGLLTGYGESMDAKISLLSRSKCYFLHRSIETWNKPPDFVSIRANMNRINQETGKNFMYSLFVAEAINVKSEYYYPDENRNFDFSAMCNPGTEGYWGADTCRPTLQSAEYKKYVRYITRKAMDLGVQDIIFGQVYYQDPNWKNNPVIGPVVEEIKNYAQKQNLDVVVGAQTNDIDDENYLAHFDYITGGIGQDAQGNIEDGPCWMYYWNSSRQSFCWAMMWNKRFKSKANNIFVYLDWNNDSNDDMNRYVRMPKEKRTRFLKEAHGFFSARDIGFLLPMGAVLDGSGHGCYGASPIFYSSSKQFSCGDEEAINSVLELSEPMRYDAKFVEQKIPQVMLSGQKYILSWEFKNEGSLIWSDDEGIKLVPVKSDSAWPISPLTLLPDEKIKPSEKKIFQLEVAAPATPGKYLFTWRLRQGQENWIGEESKEIVVQVLPVPLSPSQAIDGPACIDKQLVKCNKWCSEPGATCNALTGESACAGVWYDDKSYAKPVQCCVDADCQAGLSCQSNTCVAIEQTNT